MLAPEPVRAVRVLIDKTYVLRAPVSGTAVYLDRLITALAVIPEVEVVAVANRRRRPPAGGGTGSARNLLSDHWWTAVELPRLARRERAEVIHHPLPARARTRDVAQVVTVHDLAFERLPDKFDQAFRVYAHWSHRAAARAADAVVCVSDTTAADVRAMWGVPEEKIVVARHGRGQARETPAGTARHFLYVGDGEPRKNLPVLLAAYRLYREEAVRPYELVLAGSARGVAAGVRVESSVSPDHLAELYAGAAALVHPSLYEGFGLTPLEAMSAGTPVIAARSPGLTETCGDAALYADPRDPRSFAAAMAQIVEQPGLREDLIARGRRRAAQFSWEQSAREHVLAYQQAAHRKARR